MNKITQMASAVAMVTILGAVFLPNPASATAANAVKSKQVGLRVMDDAPCPTPSPSPSPGG